MNPTFRSRLRILSLSALVPLVWLAGCRPAGETGGGAGRPANHTPAAAASNDAAGPTVSIGNFSFDPPTLTIPAGTTVTWVNRDDVPHTVTANDKRFASAALDSDERFSHQFTAPGTYPYYCAVHTHMTARIIVK